MREQVLPIRVNCLDASGHPDTAIAWLTEELVRQLTEGMYPSGSPNWNELRSLYFREYKRRSEGVDAVLYKSDKTAFQIKFSEFLTKQTETDREGFLKRLLSELVDNRKILPVLIVDNTDEFPLSWKERVFQFSQSLRRHAKHCIVILPVTDKSAWTFSKTDIFGIYRTRSFFLPTPAPREIFRKRIEYLKEKIDVEEGDGAAKKYLSDKRIKVSISNLERFAEVLEAAFVDHESTARTMGELSNYNIRRTLNLARRVMTSSVLKIEDLLTAYAAGGGTPVSGKKFMNALIKGDYEYYRSGDDNEVVPLFQVNERVRQSPLIHLRLLALLEAAYNAARDIEGKHLTVGSIFDYFEVLGSSEVATDAALLLLLRNRLVETFDPNVSELARHQKVAITHAGRAHLRLAKSDFVFFEQMALTTAIVDADVAQSIRFALAEKTPIDRRFSKIRSVFAKFLLDADADELPGKPVGEHFESQEELLKEIEAFMTSDEVGAHKSHIRNGSAQQGDARPALVVVATVDWFSERKGYGFVNCDEVDGSVFLHSSTLQQSEFDTVSDGDELLCEVGFGTKGPVVEKVVDRNTQNIELTKEACTVVRVFRERGYGFVRPGKQ